METFKRRSKVYDFKLTSGIILVLIVFLIIFIVNYKYMENQNKTLSENHKTLILAQVLFRHGQRTPIYAPNSRSKDPYVNVTYEPYGPSALTLEGQRMAYNLGKFLKRHYSGFLGDYHRNTVFALSSPMMRNLVTIQLVLAGLFPPSESEKIAVDLNWKPIPYFYNPLDTDKVFLYVMNCKKFVKIQSELSRKAIIDKELENAEIIVRTLQSNTGRVITSVRDIFNMAMHLQMQKLMGLRLSEWAEKFLLESYSSVVSLQYDLQTRTETLKTLSAGFILKEIMDAISKKTANFSEQKDRKLYLYSGHDFTIANLLSTLGLVNLTSSPPYVSFVSIELHKIKDVFSIRLLYHDYSSELPKVLRIPNCEQMCPFPRFLELYGKYLATSDMCE